MVLSYSFYVIKCCNTHVVSVYAKIAKLLSEILRECYQSYFDASKVQTCVHQTFDLIKNIRKTNLHYPFSASGNPQTIQTGAANIRIEFPFGIITEIKTFSLARTGEIRIITNHSGNNATILDKTNQSFGRVHQLPSRFSYAIPDHNSLGITTLLTFAFDTSKELYDQNEKQLHMSRILKQFAYNKGIVQHKMLTIMNFEHGAQV